MRITRTPYTKHFVKSLENSLHFTSFCTLNTSLQLSDYMSVCVCVSVWIYFSSADVLKFVEMNCRKKKVKCAHKIITDEIRKEERLFNK